MPSHPSLAQTGHRPWPLPFGKWQWRQAWRDLAFLHYPIPASLLQPLLPPGITLQQFDGSAWLGVVPFRMADVMRGSLPALPCLSTFPELNLRTYVEVKGDPGVWFFSLDATSLAIVLGGRFIYKLPYHLARIRMQWTSAGFDYRNSRLGSTVKFDATYRPTGDVFFARPGTFAHWATERYCLFSCSSRGIARVDVHHLPWPLQNAGVKIRRNDLFSAIGLNSPAASPVCHFSTGVEVISWKSSVLPAV